MISVLAIAALAVWAIGIVVLAACLPRVIHTIPLLSIAADMQPVIFAAWLALITVGWPALPIYALLEKTTERRRP